MLTTRQNVKWVNHTHENSQALFLICIFLYETKTSI